MICDRLKPFVTGAAHTRELPGVAFPPKDSHQDLICDGEVLRFDTQAPELLALSSRSDRFVYIASSSCTRYFVWLVSLDKVFYMGNIRKRKTSQTIYFYISSRKLPLAIVTDSWIQPKRRRCNLGSIRSDDTFPAASADVADESEAHHVAQGKAEFLKPEEEQVLLKAARERANLCRSEHCANSVVVGFANNVRSSSHVFPRP